MKKTLLLLFLIMLTVPFTFKVGRALFSDKVSLILGISTADFEIFGPLTLIENKPLTADGLEPGDETVWGMLKVGNPLENDANFYMYVEKTDGKICGDLDITLEVSDDGENDWTQVYDGKLEKLKNQNKKVALVPDEDFSKDFVFVRQKVELTESIKKNEQGKDCTWREVFRIQGSDKKDYEDHKLLGNYLKAGFWIIPYVEVKDPDGGEEFRSGKEEKIRWKVKSSTKDKKDEMKIDIDLYDQSGTNFVMNIASDLPNDGTYKWLVPSDLTGDDYRVRVFAEDGNGLTNEDFSDGEFSIVED